MFKYRLERVLELREQELEKAKTDFQEATGVGEFLGIYRMKTSKFIM